MFLQTKLFLLKLLCILKLSSALDWRVFEGQDLRYEVHTSLVKLEIYGVTETYCSGSIIDTHWIITSAHCKEPGTVSMTVLHGSRNGFTTIATIPNNDIITHPNYVPNPRDSLNRANDIALLRVRRPIQFGPYMKPIGLGTFDPTAGATGIIAGYGHAENNLRTPREGAAVIIQCPFVGVNVICTRGPVRAGHGDSGGALLYNGKLVGVTSSTCVDAPTNRMCVTMYASVAGNMKWIQLITNIIFQ